MINPNRTQQIATILNEKHQFNITELILSLPELDAEIIHETPLIYILSESADIIVTHQCKYELTLWENIEELLSVIPNTAEMIYLAVEYSEDNQLKWLFYSKLSWDVIINREIKKLTNKKLNNFNKRKLIIKANRLWEEINNNSILRESVQFINSAEIINFANLIQPDPSTQKGPITVTDIRWNWLNIGHREFKPIIVKGTYKDINNTIHESRISYGSPENTNEIIVLEFLVAVYEYILMHGGHIDDNAREKHLPYLPIDYAYTVVKTNDTLQEGDLIWEKLKFEYKKIIKKPTSYMQHVKYAGTIKDEFTFAIRQI